MKTDGTILFARCFRELPAFEAMRSRFFTPDELVARMDREGLEKIFVCPVVNVESAFGTQSNEEAIDLCTTSCGRLVPFANVDPRNCFNSAKADLAWTLEHYRRQGCVGCGVCEACLPIEDRRVRNLFKAVEANGLPLVIRLAPFPGMDIGLSDERGLPGLARALEDFPRLVLHVAGVNRFAENEKALETLRQAHPNLRTAREVVK